MSCCPVLKELVDLHDIFRGLIRTETKIFLYVIFDLWILKFFHEGIVTIRPPPMSPARAMTLQKALQMFSLETLPMISSGR